MKKSTWAIAGLVIGILSFVQLFGLEKGIVAVVFGVLALKEIASKQEIEGRRIAISGIILGVIYIAILIYLALFTPYLKNILNKLTA